MGLGCVCVFGGLDGVAYRLTEGCELYHLSRQLINNNNNNNNNNKG